MRLVPPSMRLAPTAVPCLSTAAMPRLGRPGLASDSVRPPRRAAAAVGVPLALAGVLLGLAVLVAPEQPADQEAICHRHNGVAACRVW
jgi:hypothetical protein